MEVETIKGDVGMSLKKQPLGQLISISKGKKHLPSGHGSYRYINIEDLHNPLHSIFTNEKGTVVNEDDLIIAWDGANAGKVGVGFNGVIGSTLARLSLKTNNVEPRFLFWYLESQNDIIKSQRTGATIPHVNGNALKDLEIPLPPLATQKRIAEILDAADALRRKDQELLKKYDELAQAIFIDMFGDPVKNEKGWDQVRLGNISKIKGGKRLPLGDKLVKYDTGLPYIKAGNIKAGRVTLNDMEFLLPETQTKIKNYTVKEGDVCVTIVGVNIGDVGIVPKELDGANLTENAAKIMVDDNSKLNNVYLSNYWSMPFIQSEIKKRAMAVGVPKLALFRIEEIEILIPPHSLQLKFNKSIKILNEHFNKSIQNKIYSLNIFDSLIQKAFKGELV
jgi:type I restriction enzyme S subunit